MSAPRPIGGRHYIHYDPDRTDYAVTGDELARLEAAGSNLWKDLCLVAVPLGVGCLINAIATTPNPFELSYGLFLNYLIGSLGSILGLVFGFAWWRSHKSIRKIINDIKCKPKMQIAVPGVVDVGALPQAIVHPSQTANDPRASHAQVSSQGHG